MWAQQVEASLKAIKVGLSRAQIEGEWICEGEYRLTVILESNKIQAIFIEKAYQRVTELGGIITISAVEGKLQLAITNPHAEATQELLAKRNQ